MRPRTDRRERSGDRLGQLRSFNRRPSCHRPSTAPLVAISPGCAECADAACADAALFRRISSCEASHGLRSKLAG
jgi:hypothetical protein